MTNRHSDRIHRLHECRCPSNRLSVRVAVCAVLAGVALAAVVAALIIATNPLP